MQRSPARPRQQLKLPLLALVSFFSVLLSLVCLTVLVSYFSGESFVFGLLVSCPLVMVLWLWAQNHQRDKTPATALKRAADICLTRLPENAKIMLALASSGYIGRLSAEMVPAEYLSDNLGLMSMPDIYGADLLDGSDDTFFMAWCQSYYDGCFFWQPLRQPSCFASGPDISRTSDFLRVGLVNDHFTLRNCCTDGVFFKWQESSSADLRLELCILNNGNALFVRYFLHANRGKINSVGR